MNDPLQQPADVPVEEVEFTFKQGAARFLWSAPFLTLIISGMIVGMMVLFAVCMVLARGLPPNGAGEVAKKLLGFAALVGGFIGLITIPLTLFSCLTGRRRKYWVESNQLFGVSGRKEPTKLDLEECTYFCLGSITADAQGFYRGSLKPRIRVYDGDKQISLGFTEESSQQWSQYLDSVGVKRESTPPFLRALTLGFVTMIFGVVIGFLVDRLVILAGGPAIPPGSLCFIGALDGGILGTFFVLIRHRSAKANEILKWPVLPVLLVGTLFSGFGMQWSSVWQVGVSNGIIGALCTWAMLPQANFYKTEDAK